MKEGDALSLPKGWEIKKLGDVCELKSGTTISPSLERTEGDVLYTKVGDMNLPDNEIEINTSSRFVNSNEIKINQIIPEGAIIFPKRGGAIATNKKRKIIKPTIVDLNTMAIIPSRKIDKDYFFHWFQLFDLNSISNGTNIPQINNYSFDEVYIPFPKSLPEQQRIVTILDQAFAAIATAKANAQLNLKNAKQLFESYLQGVFENKGEGWEEKTLGEVCEFSQGIQRDVKMQSEIQAVNQVRFLRIVDFTQGNELPRFIDNPGVKYVLNENDISIVRYGASTGFVCRGIKGALANNLFRVIPKSKKELSNEFLFAFLISPVFQNVIKESMNGAAMPAISFGLIKDIPFPIIPLQNQKAIVQKLDALSSETKKLESIYQQKLADLEELKKSVLQKAFAGELRSPEGATYTNDGFSPSITKEAEHTNDSYNPSAKNKKPINSPKGT